MVSRVSHCSQVAAVIAVGLFAPMRAMATPAAPDARGFNYAAAAAAIAAPAAADAQLAVTCPAHTMAASYDGGPVPVTYSPRTTGGIAPISVIGDTPSGSAFRAGDTWVLVTASSADRQVATCWFMVTVIDMSPPPPVSAPLAVSCPTHTMVASYDRQPVRVTYSPTTTGGIAPVSVIGDTPSGSTFPVGDTWVRVSASSADRQAASCWFMVTVIDMTPPTPVPLPLAIACPTHTMVASYDRAPVQVTYAATTSGGTDPVSAVGDTPSGSLFPLGDTWVLVTASSSDRQIASCWFMVTVVDMAPPTAPQPVDPPAVVLPVIGVGPQVAIACPADAVDIWPQQSIPMIVNSHTGGTAFCLRAGVHYLTSSITPKTGDIFVGEYGAVLDGSQWVSNESTQAAFRAHNEDIDYVTIRNLVIRNMPQRGIHAFYYMADHWTIEHNEIASNLTGVVFPNDTILRSNHIHHNTAGGYLGTYASNSVIEGNEIAFNGPEQKVGESVNVIFRNNFVHHNLRDGIWLDSNNTGTIIEGNRVEDNAGSGIFYEISSDLIVRDNTARRNGEAGVFVSTSQNVDIYRNTIEHNHFGILYFVNCSSVGGGAIGFDLANTRAHDNTIRLGTQPDALLAGFSHTLCSPTQVAAYRDGSKNLTFSGNTYHVPSLAGWYWLWERTMFWEWWQSIGQDSAGSVAN